jgi:hypothetical protein
MLPDQRRRDGRGGRGRGGRGGARQQGPGGKNKKLVWSSIMQTAFLWIKQLLCEATCLAHPDPAAEISLAVDASDTHVGAVLQQRRGDCWQPLTFYSKKLDSAQKKYSAFDRELLAAYLAVRHFRCLLEGGQFAVFTDHKPLTYAVHRVFEPWLAGQQRQLSYLVEFTSDFRYVPGVQNVVADALSRPGGDGGNGSLTPRQLNFIRQGQQEATISQVAGVDFADLAAKQNSCLVLPPIS